MKKYRLKNQIAQMALDAITNGEFTKRLNGDIEISIELQETLGCIAMDLANYGAGLDRLGFDEVEDEQ